MITRRGLIFLLGCFGLACVRAKPHSNLLAAPSDETNDQTPHLAALALVWKMQKESIKELELQHARVEQSQQKEYVSADERWWFDTDERHWTVVRPFSPGGVDSTHWFTVTYVVGKKRSVSWQVDTRKQQVSVIK